MAMFAVVAYFLAICTVLLLVCGGYFLISSYLSIRFCSLNVLPTVPLNILGSYGYIKQFQHQLKPLTEWTRSFGRVRRSFNFLGTPRLEVADPLWAKCVLTDNGKTFQRVDFSRSAIEGFKRLCGETSILLVDGAYHRHLRKLISPAFKVEIDQCDEFMFNLGIILAVFANLIMTRSTFIQPTMLSQFLPTFNSTTDRLVKKWRLACKENDGRAAVFIKDDISDLTLDVIGLTAFGQEFNAVQGDSEFGRMFKIITAASDFSLLPFMPGYSLLVSLVHLLATTLPLARVRKSGVLWGYYLLLKIRETVRQIVLRKTANSFHRDDLKKQEKMEMNGSIALPETTTLTSKSLIQLITEAESEGRLSCQELQDMAVSFIVAGHETSSVALSWLLYLLAKNPECQEKFRDEVAAVLGPTGTERSDWIEQLDKLKYVSACIHETLRLYPPIAFLGRCPVSASSQIAGCPLPRDTTIVVGIYEIHRDPELWQSPNDFKPERFLDQPDLVTDSKFLPFGAGPHKCIGYQFATSEMMIIATRLLAAFKFDLIEGDEFYERNVVTLMPTPSLRLEISLI